MHGLQRIEESPGHERAPGQQAATGVLSSRTLAMALASETHQFEAWIAITDAYLRNVVLPVIVKAHAPPAFGSTDGDVPESAS